MKRNFLSNFVLIAVIGITFAGCPIGNEENNNQQTETPQSVTYASTDSGGNRYTLTITENKSDTRTAYTPQKEDFFTLDVELYNDGTSSVSFTCSGTVLNFVGTTLNLWLSANDAPLAITIENGNMTVISGTIISDDGETEMTLPETETLTPVTPKEQKPSEIYDIYIAGIEYNDANIMPFYLKNGVKAPLSSTGEYVIIKDIIVSGSDVYVLGSDCYWKNGTRVALSTEYTANVYNMVVSGQDVYVVGIERNDSGSFSAACYWKNGNKVSLPDAAIHTYSDVDIFVSGSDVYVISGNGYWKNGTRVTLSDVFFWASIIRVYGSDVYVAGHEYVDNPSYPEDSSGRSSFSVASYWKNGKKVVLSDGTKDAYPYDLIVSGGVVYVFGREISWSGGFSSEAPCYWQNGVKIPHSEGMAYSFGVSGSDVYIAGVDVEGPCYWQNGIKVLLAAGTDGGWVRDMAMSGTDVFILGFVTNDDNGTACYWKNGVRIDLTDVTGDVNCIAVVAKNNPRTFKSPLIRDGLREKSAWL